MRAEAGCAWRGGALRRCGVRAAAALALWCALLASLEASAEERRIVSARYGISVERPEGWRFESSPEGVVASFSESWHGRNRMELRVSPHIPATQKSSYIEAFRHGLKEGGWVEQGEPISARYGALEGRELAFQGADAQRLVVFAFFYGESAYMLLGYFEPARLEQLHELFEGTVRTIQLNAQEEAEP